jgi:hypothetical protein
MQVLAPFGLKPIYHPSGQIRPRALAGGILSGYNSTLYLGTPVAISSGSGSIILPAAVSSAIVGSFAGCQFVDANGRTQVQGDWIAGTVATNIIAFFHDDPAILYAIQANGPIFQTNIGLQANFITGQPGSGSTTTQVSTDTLNSATIASGSQGLLRIVDFYQDPNNAVGDLFTTVVVQIAKHQYLNPQPAI